MNSLQQLAELGQSIWLDYIRRGMLINGELRGLIENDFLTGMTSNPAIFEKAINDSPDYVAGLREADALDPDAKATYERLAVGDIQMAANILAPVYKRTNKDDGYVSLEVSPNLAHKTREAMEEARRLWLLVDRPNLMIKVPATEEGFPAIQQLIADGLNINITLLFGVGEYERVAEAYISGLEMRAQNDMDLRGIASVASFFVSRIDTQADKRLNDLIDKGGGTGGDMAARLLGKIAIANAKLAYLKSVEIYKSPRWLVLEKKGARKQRLLWASTGVKNPAYPDTLYVEELIGPETVNTMPPATLEAFRDHGRVRPSLAENTDKAIETLASLEEIGISLKEITDFLVEDGVASFAKEFNKLIETLDAKRHVLVS